MFKINQTLLAFLLSLCIAAPSVCAAASKTTIKGKLESGEGYQVVLIDGSGKVSLSKVSASGAFSLKSSKLKGSTLALLDPSGRAFGPIVLSLKKSANKAYLGFSGKLSGDSKVINLGKVQLKTGYGLPKRKVPNNIVSTKGNLVSTTDSSGNPIGAATGGIATSSARRAKIKADTGDGLSSPGSDTDADGIIDAIDPDIDGDGIVNIADEDFAGNDDATFSSLVVDYNNTLNSNIGSITQSAIDAVISGAHLFSIGFWFSLPSDSSITGGHVICSDTNEYCNQTTGTAIYGGLTESNQSLVGQLWRNLNADGSGYPNFELLNVRGFSAVAASIEPRAGTSAVRPGDTYLVEYTGSGGAVQATKLLVLSPYMVTVPAIKSYTVNSVETTIDYGNISTQPGSFGNPIVTDSSGRITFTFWRPQRLLYRSETPSSESDRYRDMGHLKYGLIVEGGSQQYTCAGLYSSLSGGITEVSDGLGTGGSPFPDQGAKLYPLRDSSDDAVPSASRVLSVTVDLRTCLTRASDSVGTKTIRLVAQGEDLSGGSNSSSQMFNVTVQ